MSKPIKTVADRARLATRDEPHWERLRKGGALGFYKGKLGASWRGRFIPSGGKPMRCPDPVLDTLGDTATSYDAARRVVDAWLDTLGSVGVRTVLRGTVRDAFLAGNEQLRKLNRADTAATKDAAFRWTLGNDPLADMPFESVTREDVQAWRERLQAGKKGRSLKPQTVNDYVKRAKTCVRRALRLGFAGAFAAWDLEPLNTGATTMHTDLLSPAQRAAIIAHASPSLALLLRALDLTGARPHELCKATVADYNRERGTVRLSHRKGKGELRERDVVLGPKGRALFAEAAAGKIGLALLFPSWCGKRWLRAGWADHFRAAVKAARAAGTDLPRTVRAYSFRHAHISEAIQLHGFDAMTVAKQHGTSVQIIEKHYFRLMDSDLRKRLASVG
jgi:integrase